MKAYPNPGKSQSIIEYSLPEQTEAGFFMFNNLGQMIMKKNIQINKNQVNKTLIDVSQLTKGIYYYGFSLASGEKIVDKLIVTN